MTKPSLCLIVWNEVEGCRHDVPKLPRNIFGEIYAVDGGSSDGTVEYLQSQGITVFRQPRPSLNAAYWHAVENCQSSELVIYFPKNTIDPAYLERIVDTLGKGYEVVIASRNIKGARNEEDQHLLKPRKWGVLTLSLLAAILWRREGAYIRDVLHGVKGFTIDSFRKMEISKTGLSIDLEMTIRAYRMRISRIEIPVVESARSHGETTFKIWPTAKKLLFFLYKELSRKIPGH